jgi:hypothetical protein
MSRFDEWMIRILGDRLFTLYERWRYPPRPMTGLWSTLTDEQKKRILEYDGPENSGDTTLPRVKGARYSPDRNNP